MKKKFNNTNRTFCSEELSTNTDKYLVVQTSTLYSADSKMNPIKATDDIVYIELVDDENVPPEERASIQLNKEQALKLIAAIATAASNLRDNI